MPLFLTLSLSLPIPPSFSLSLSLSLSLSFCVSLFLYISISISLSLCLSRPLYLLSSGGISRIGPDSSPLGAIPSNFCSIRWNQLIKSRDATTLIAVFYREKLTRNLFRFRKKRTKMIVSFFPKSKFFGNVFFVPSLIKSEGIFSRSTHTHTLTHTTPPPPHTHTHSPLIANS